MPVRFISELRTRYEHMERDELEAHLQQVLWRPGDCDDNMLKEFLLDLSIQKLRPISPVIGDEATAAKWLAFAVRILWPLASGQPRRLTETQLESRMSDLDDGRLWSLLFGTEKQCKEKLRGKWIQSIIPEDLPELTKVQEDFWKNFKKKKLPSASRSYVDWSDQLESELVAVAAKKLKPTWLERLVPDTNLPIGATPFDRYAEQAEDSFLRFQAIVFRDEVRFRKNNALAYKKTLQKFFVPFVGYLSIVRLVTKQKQLRNVLMAVPSVTYIVLALLWLDKDASAEAREKSAMRTLLILDGDNESKE